METVTNAWETLAQQAVLLLPRLVVALLIMGATLVLAGFLCRAVARALERRKAGPELTLLVTRIVRWATIALGAVVALQQVNFDVTAFLAGLGVIGFTIGFALQDVSKNLVSGVLLLLERPFDLGDAIKVADVTGKVTAVELRATTIETFEGTTVMIPNADVFTKPIENLGRLPVRRLAVKAGVAYESDLEEVRATALAAIGALDGVLEDPAPRVVYENLGPSTVDFTLYYWINTADTNLLVAKDGGICAIKAAFERAGIEMPYPIQTVHLRQ